jgi:hypothetical protein
MIFIGLACKQNSPGEHGFYHHSNPKSRSKSWTNWKFTGNMFELSSWKYVSFFFFRVTPKKNTDFRYQSTSGGNWWCPVHRSVQRGAVGLKAVYFCRGTAPVKRPWYEHPKRWGYQCTMVISMAYIYIIIYLDIDIDDRNMLIVWNHQRINHQ